MLGWESDRPCAVLCDGPGGEAITRRLRGGGVSAAWWCAWAMATMFALLAAACSTPEEAPYLGDAGETTTITPATDAGNPDRAAGMTGATTTSTSTSAASGYETDAVETDDVETDDDETDVTVEADADAKVDAGDMPAVAAVRADTVEWFDCGIERLECGVVRVPVDYREPSAGELELLIAVHRATHPEKRIGYLVVNPGGPGGSGVEMAAGALYGPGAVFTVPVLERFDIVGFDPRGVGLSEPIFVCGEPGEQLALLSRVDPPYDSAEEFATGESVVQLCVESMGAVAGLLHTEYVARDLDEIRKALGAEQVSYFGASYGSTLGVWYATLFPAAVRAMVVDGADNPVDDVSTVEARVTNVIDELRQFEVLLGEALDACDSPECPMYNDGDPRGYFTGNVDALEAVVEATGGNPMAGALSILTPLYSRERWPYLWDGYARLVEEGDPSVLAEFALLQLGDSTGGITFTEHVNCLDSWVLNPQLDRSVRLSDESASVAALHRELPLLAHLDPSAPNTCAFYDLLDLGSFTGSLDGGGVPIVVIGNPEDPATPFTESLELVEETLSNGYLVQAEHFAHVVYPNNGCANEIVHAALIDLELPAERTTVC